MKTTLFAGIAAVITISAACAVRPASAQQPPQVVHGTIDKVEGSTVFIKQAEGPDVSVKLMPTTLMCLA